MNSRFKKLKKATDILGLYTEPEMARIHEYERLRTDRNGMKFSHVVLDLNLEALRNRSITHLLAKLLKQLRITDHIGWEDSGQIGIILPGTDEIGATHFVRITNELIGGTPGIDVKLSATYPLPETLMAAVSSSSTASEKQVSSDAVEPEEVTIIPFGVAN